MPPNITKAVEEHIADLKRQIAPLQRQLSAAEEYLKALVQGNEAQALEKGKRIAPPKRKGQKLAQHGKTHREYVRDLLRKHAAEGLTPMQIRTLSSGERTFPDSYPYEQLATMKKLGEVEKVGAKYHPAKPEAKAVAAVTQG